jgi:hypothetical protein
VSAPPLAPGLASDDYSSLESFAAHIQELVLHLRDEGHVLSSVDQHYIELWWQAGYRLDVVLRAVLDGGRRLLARKNRPRGLPLKSLNKKVTKMGAAAADRAVGAPRPERASDPASLAGRLLRDVEAALEREPTPARRAARDALRPLALSPGPTTFTECLAVSRRYYDAILSALSPVSADALREDALASLGDAARRMAPEGLSETVEELARRSLRKQDSLLDPTEWVADP